MDHKLLLILSLILFGKMAHAAQEDSACKTVNVAVGVFLHLKLSTSYIHEYWEVKARYMKKFRMADNSSNEFALMAGINLPLDIYEFSITSGVNLTAGTRRGRYLYTEYQPYSIINNGGGVNEKRYYQEIHYLVLGIPIETSLSLFDMNHRYGLGFTGVANLNPQRIDWGLLFHITYNINF